MKIGIFFFWEFIQKYWRVDSELFWKRHFNGWPWEESWREGRVWEMVSGLVIRALVLEELLDITEQFLIAHFEHYNLVSCSFARGFADQVFPTMVAACSLLLDCLSRGIVSSSQTNQNSHFGVGEVIHQCPRMHRWQPHGWPCFHILAPASDRQAGWHGHLV